MMSYVGQQKQQQQPHLWDSWESHNADTDTTTTTVATTYHHHLSNSTNSSSLGSSTPFLEYCIPPLFPMNGIPFYVAPPAEPEYPSFAVFKGEDSGGRIGLNLGHRTYFSSGDAMSVDRLFAGYRGVYSLGHHHHQQPGCQAEGCKADLSGAKRYHLRHKVCEHHSKAAFVIAGGMQQRFCQQCSRFHVLSEFDEARRSCRKRLADHNRRRRKPHPISTTSSAEEELAPKNPTISSCKAKHSSPYPDTATSIISPDKRVEKQGLATSTISLDNCLEKQGLSLGSNEAVENVTMECLEKQGLSLGSNEAVENVTMEWSQSRYQPHQRVLSLIMSDDDQKSSQQHQHPHLSFAPSWPLPPTQYCSTATTASSLQ